VIVKICGITCVEDAITAAALGVDAIGVNFVPASKRRVDEATAQAIVAAVGRRVTVVAVVADLDVDAMRALRERTGVHELQLHGSEEPDVLAAVLPRAYKALRIGSSADVLGASRYGGDQILVDARVEGALGGSGVTFDWRWVQGLCHGRRVMLAGGLTPDNVARAVKETQPYGVDVASGVEPTGEPRRKDAAKMRAFVEAARSGVF
jgi:phosphoribosylanthranilate isomerase